MKKIAADSVDYNVAGLVINQDGQIIVMEEETHRSFFEKVLKEELGFDVKEDSLDVLITLLMNEFNYLPYMGCTSGDRKYDGGSLFIKELSNIKNEQLNAIIALYSNISQYYPVEIISLAEGYDDQIVSIGEVYEELLSRDTKKI